MFLKRLELQGFKTFAQKTALEFLPDAQGRRGITAIVGPNGSGKSNVADAIRWVMGEQSLKLLRGKKSEDVIFSGSTSRARSGFAEVTLILENEAGSAHVDGMPAELEITRRLYRDGQSEYLLNREAARLQDIVLFLSQAGVSQRSYSVIGQGMIDHVFVASPAERKEFFEEAFGVRPFQLKRQNALHKLDATREHVGQTEAILRELEPRVSSLARQAKRLQERDSLLEEVRTLERRVYGIQYRELSRALKTARDRHVQVVAEQSAKETEMQTLQRELDGMEQAVPVLDGFQEARKTLDALQRERTKIREQQLALETKRAVAAVRAEKPWSPLPLSKIIERLDAMHAKHEALLQILREQSVDVVSVRQAFEELHALSADLIGKLQRPAPEPTTTVQSDPALEREYFALVQAMQDMETRLAHAQQEVETWHAKERDSRQQVFVTQHKLTSLRESVRTIERRVSEAAIEVARQETRREGFISELRLHAPQLENELEAIASTLDDRPLEPEAPARLQKARTQLEWIGGIDPQVIKEFEDTKTRYDFLQTQVMDLNASIADLEIVVTELDATIRERSVKAFETLNREFSAAFKRLFGGGEASLVEMQAEPEVDEEGNEIGGTENKEAIAGIEIQATPPGKRFKSIALLSGGERALTSIALICAIMATNPSPFIVLDEVDAALDESNARKFGEIIHDLAHHTQFVVITHNRMTMMQAHVLYGVTMGQDGLSQLLSVKLEDVEKLKKTE